MDLAQPDDLILALKLAGLKPKKGLGQHFLVDRTSLNQIVDAAELTPADTVLEIGPGLGVLTEQLTKVGGQVVAVEADRELAELLSRDAPANLQIITDDIINFNLGQLPSGYKVVANLPYYLTGQILRRLIDSPNPPSLLVLLLQREVAERITAPPGRMSVLAVTTQYAASAELVGLVERQKFYPPPKVHSAILRLRRRQTPIFVADRAKLFRLVKAGFGERRKQLKNSLAGGLNASPELIATIVQQSKLAPTARAQELSLSDWGRLYDQATRHGLLD